MGTGCCGGDRAGTLLPRPQPPGRRPGEDPGGRRVRAAWDAAAVLKLGDKGRVAAGADADLVVPEAGSLEVVEVIAGGRRLVRGGAVAGDEPGANARGAG